MRPPGPPRRATIGLLRKLFTDRLALMVDAAAEHGDVVRIAIGPKALYLVNHPDPVKHVLADNNANYRKGIGLAQARDALGDGLLTSDGELWHAQRKVIQPAFQHRRVAAQAGIVADEAAKLVARLRAHEGGAPVDVLPEFAGFTLGVLGRTLLDTDLSGLDSIGHSFEAVQDQAIFDAVTLNLVPGWVPLPRRRRFLKARARLRQIAEELVAARTGDLLSRMLVAAGGEPDGQIRDELITLLLAGHETTASTLGWTFALLDQHPDVAARLHEEAVAVLGERLPVHDDLRRLSYTVAVVEEVLRLYPPVWLLPRVSLQADEIGGYHVPAGADVVVCPYALHRHPDFWDQPEQFVPERSSARSRYAYIPFGAGPRVCVGSSLGMIEVVLTVAMIARDLRLAKAPGHQVIAEPMLSLRIRGGLPMTVRPHFFKPR